MERIDGIATNASWKLRGMQNSLFTEELAFTPRARIGSLGSTRKRDGEEQRRHFSVRALLLAAACMLIWAAPWWALIHAYRFPPQAPPLNVAATNSATAFLAPPCRAGTIEVNGSCVLGEEIIVRTPMRLSAR